MSGLWLQSNVVICYEGTFLSKLKAECGVHFIAKMEGMFNDTRQTDEMMESYAVFLKPHQEVGNCRAAGPPQPAPKFPGKATVRPQEATYPRRSSGRASAAATAKAPPRDCRKIDRGSTGRTGLR